MQSDQRALSFMIPHLGISSRRELQHSLRILSLREEIRLKTIFEEELVSLPKLIHIVVPTPIQDNIVFPEEQTQHPQHLPLR